MNGSWMHCDFGEMGVGVANRQRRYAPAANRLVPTNFGHATIPACMANLFPREYQL